MKKRSISGCRVKILMCFLLSFMYFFSYSQSLLGASVTYIDGQYEGEGEGFNGIIKVSLSIKDDYIESIKILSQNETPKYWDKAKVLTDEIIKNQTVEVDAISGATISCNGIKKAVLDALKKAVKENEDKTLVFAGGEGTKNNPYLIKTENQLINFAGSCNENNDYSGQYIKLDNDINITKNDWSPIGGEEYKFNGTFDGDGHYIKGLKKGSYSKSVTITNFGFFRSLDENAVVKNLNLSDIYFNVDGNSMVSVGGITAYTEKSYKEGDVSGALIDNCSVTGTIKLSSNTGNNFVGGITGMQVKGAVINSYTDVDLYTIVNDGKMRAEVGGIVGSLGMGTIANCYSLGNVTALHDGNDGIAVAGNITAIADGPVINCYACGNVKVRGNISYGGIIAGISDEDGKVYSCRYNKNAKINGSAKNTLGVCHRIEVPDEKNIFLEGGIVEDVTAFSGKNYKEIVSRLNALFSEFPIDISCYISDDYTLKKWKLDEDENVVLSDEKADFLYVLAKPVYVPIDMKDGNWTGRDKNKKSIVSITVKNGEVVKKSIVGEKCGENFEEAFYKARQKANIGDSSDYKKADMTKFDKGKGTKASPYLLHTKEQLSYIAKALNEDESFKDIYFKLTDSITLTGSWLPIGWSIQNEAGEVVASYPFEGHFNGDNYTISMVNIDGSDTRAVSNAGLFGIVKGSDISNIHVKNINIKLQDNIKSHNIGGLVAYATDALVKNCSTEGKMCALSPKSTINIGGLIGYGYKSNVNNCYSDIEIEGDSPLGMVNLGGLYGMEDMLHTVNVSSFGSIYVTASNPRTGGISGQSQNGSHENVVALVDLLDRGFSGAIYGLSINNKNKNVFYKESNLPAIAYPKGEVDGALKKSLNEILKKDFIEFLNEEKDKSDKKELRDWIIDGDKIHPFITFNTQSKTDVKPKPEPTVKKLKKGDTFSYKGATYLITKTDKTVQFKKLNKNNYKSVDIPSSIRIKGTTYKVEEIGAKALKNMTVIKKLTIGENIKIIGDEAFRNCKNLENITIKTTKLTLKCLGKNIFKDLSKDNYKKLIIVVPKNKIKTYKKMFLKKGLNSLAKIKMIKKEGK
ncbi:Leucine rich repeat-containing protein [Acetitomaculum ruminis DSM 5522]|uniref:Leucine rich repeat-containing protein n=1 Tax=Acetitomaculum ruminis DSM 5522 TaxID=1120918 RepID=A0A1I0X7A3_9FIRM|nr:FMN-binding protein [Acetitomaculum ruminis]SFA96919.1 Leucine rich repeat-containing protein [Acetitomaculum ruminis DSM 5522]